MFFWRYKIKFSIIFGLIGLIPTFLALQDFVSFFPEDYNFFGYIISFVIVVSAALFLIINMVTLKEVPAYERSQNFIGLYDTAKIEVDEKLIIRKNEVDFLKSKIDKMILGKLCNKTICLVGESGCGKSTIINMLCKDDQLKEKVDIVECSSNYMDFFTKIRNIFGETLGDVNKHLNAMDKPVLFIFDQFERFFFLNDKEKKEFRKSYLASLSSEKVVSIFVLRNEFLAQFTYNINLFDITNNFRRNVGVLTYYLPRENQELPQFFYCDNSNVFAENYDSRYIESFQGRNKDIENLCQLAFNDLKDDIYNEFKTDKLIEQQIFLNILENDKRFLSKTDLALALDRELLIKKYFDRQLCSTGDYANASKIMYLFSRGRKFHKTFSINEIYNALYTTQKSKVDECIQNLENLQLIRPIQKDMDSYEIVHDYIADKFIEYCEKEIKPEIKMTLDNYISNSGNQYFMIRAESIIKRKEKMPVFANILLIVTLFSTLAIPTYNFIVNKIDVKYYIIIVPALFATYYGYSMYKNIIRLTNKKIYLLLLPFMALMEAFCLFCFDYWGFWLGIATIAIGLSLILISKENLFEVSKKFFFNFGGKVVLTGVTISILGAFLKSQVILAFSLMMVIIFYAYIAQMNEDYFFYCSGFLNLKNEHKKNAKKRKAK